MLRSDPEDFDRGPEMLGAVCFLILGFAALLFIALYLLSLL